MPTSIKRLLALVFLMAAGAAKAATIFDGVYLCSLIIVGVGTTDQYFSVVSNNAGVTVFAPAGIALINDVYGYGIGRVSGNTFSGQTNFGQPFSLFQNATTGGMYGSAGLAIQGRVFNVLMPCERVL